MATKSKQKSKTDEWLENMGYGPLLTIRETAQILNYNTKSLYRLISNNSFPLEVIDIGTQKRIRRDSIAELMDQSINIKKRNKNRGRPRKSEVIKREKMKCDDECRI